MKHPVLKRHHLVRDPTHSARRLPAYLMLVGSLLASVCFGCASEKAVDITLATSSRDSTIVVEDTLIEMTEGEAIGIQVEAVEENEAKPQWSIHATSENRSYVEVAETKEDDVFVLIAKRPGSTNLRFELRDRDFIYVPVTIHRREQSTQAAVGGANAD